MSTISPLAYVSPDAQLGKNITIQPFAAIYEDVVIGDNVFIGTGAVLNPGARIGSECQIFPGAVIASIPQDLKFANEYSLVIIEDKVIIREYATINRGTKDSFETRIGANTLVMAYVHVAHDCIIGKNVILVNAVNVAGHVTVDDFAVVGGGCAVHQFNRIGKHAMIAGGCMVRKDVPPYVMAGRTPIAYVGINKVGLKRRGFTAEQLNIIQDSYRLLFQSQMPYNEAILRIEETIAPSIERNSILEFVKLSSRGLMRGYQ